MHPPPDILKYADYRKYLGDRYRFLKLNQRKFSHRFINDKVGIRSSGWFGDVLAGRQRLKPVQVKKVSSVFKLSQREQDCLAALVLLDNASSPEESALAYERWYEAKGIGQETVAKDRFRFYERWYFSALRELLALYPGARTPESLAAALDPPITARQAQEAVALLERLGLAGNGGGEGPKASPSVLVKDAAARTRHWKKMMAAMMKLGRRALEKYGREERNFSGLTLAFSAEGMKQAGEEIAALRKRLLFLSEKDKRRDRVYNCLFQLYPISKPPEANRASV